MNRVCHGFMGHPHLALRHLFILMGMTTLILTLAGCSNNNSGGTQPIVATKLGFIAQPSAVSPGVVIAPAVQVAIQASNGATVTSSSAQVTLSIVTNPGGSTLGGTITVNAVNGIATFSNLTLNQAGVGYTLAATSPGLTPATSASFSVQTIVATKLGFIAQPSTVVQGAVIAPAVQVAIQAANGATVTSSSAQVTLSIATNSGGSTLGGTITVNAVNGIATFSNLTLNQAGVGYTLAATSPGLTPATSASFSVQTVSLATKLGFIAQPSTVVQGAVIAPAVQVAIQASNGATVTSSSAQVTLSIATNSGGSTLGGTITVNAVNGIATFSNLTLNQPGTGYTLAATSPGLTPATSIGFNVAVSGSAPPTASAISVVISSLEVGTFVAGAPPSSGPDFPLSGGPGSLGIVAGNTFGLSLCSSSATNTMLVKVAGSSDGFYRVAVSGPCEELFVIIDPDVPVGTSFDVAVAAGNGTSFGAFVNTRVTVTKTAGMGTLAFKLSWDTDADVDLQVFTPNGGRFPLKFSNTPLDGGIFDLQSGDFTCPTGTFRAENAFWPDEPPIGTYEVVVDFFSACNFHPTKWDLTVYRNGIAFAHRAGSFDSGPGDNGTGGPHGTGGSVEFTHTEPFTGPSLINIQNTASSRDGARHPAR